VSERKPSIVCVVESWLSDEISDKEIEIESYTIVRLDRNRQGGGVIMYIHTLLSWRVLLRGTDGLEFLALQVAPASNSKFKFYMSCCYRAPSSSPTLRLVKYLAISHADECNK